ncbi:SIMPL domain-containing protein, partial [Nocardia cyriacigeorgica]|nr:SIMPL domain-containing protein [Nocardia cyriacigeorgica]
SRGAAEIAYAAAPVPVELGESEIAADLRVTWQLD